MNLEIADGDVRHESNVHKKIKSNFHRIVESMRTESLGRSWCFRSEHFSYDISSSRRSNELNRMGTSALSQQIFFTSHLRKFKTEENEKKVFVRDGVSLRLVKKPLPFPLLVPFDRATPKGFPGRPGPVQGRRLGGHVEHNLGGRVFGLGDDPRRRCGQPLHWKAQLQPRTERYVCLNG